MGRNLKFGCALPSVTAKSMATGWPCTTTSQCLLIWRQAKPRWTSSRDQQITIDLEPAVSRLYRFYFQPFCFVSLGIGNPRCCSGILQRQYWRFCGLRFSRCGFAPQGKVEDALQAHRALVHPPARTANHAKDIERCCR